MVTIIDVIREAVLRSALTRYEIAKRSRIDQAALLRFVRGGSLRIETLERLCPVLGLRVDVFAVEDGREVKSGSARKGSRSASRRKS
jgi:transcriptional regulator with XRE-family HTH domain